MSTNSDWNAKQKTLGRLISKDVTFPEAMTLCMAMHAELHDLSISGKKNAYQALIDGLTPDSVVYRPANHFSSIAWNVWHIARVEDAITNILIADTEQVISKEWLERIRMDVTDTGNAFSEKDVDMLDTQIDVKELFMYRKMVGKKTRMILKGITVEDRKRKPTKQQLDRIIAEKVLTKEKESIWLLEFWGNKTVAGLLTMPITRHQMVHINDCYRIKETYQKKHD